MMWRMPHNYLWHKPANGGVPRPDNAWSISLADLMTLLLCFFALLVAMSPPPTSQGAKYHQVVASLRSVFGTARDGGGSTRGGTLVDQLAAMTEGGRTATGASGGPHLLSLFHEPDGLHATLSGRIAFPGDGPVAGRLSAGADAALRRLAEGLCRLDPRVEVRAYNVPPSSSGKVPQDAAGTPGVSGFDEGFARAKAVANVLAQCGLSADRLQWVVAHDASSPGSGGAASPRDPCRVELIVQAQGDSIEDPMPASGAPPARGKESPHG